MNKIKTLVRKEILDILRDRKTLIIMVAVPVLLYPAMIMGMVLIISMIAQSQEGKVHIAGYDKEYRELAAQLEEVYEENKDELDVKLNFLSMSASDKEKAEFYDAWIDFKETETSTEIIVEYTSTNQDSSYTENVLWEIVDIYRDKLLAEKLVDQGLTEEFLYPVTYESKDSVSASESVGMNLGGSIGMLLVVTIMLGAFYPAIDATTGEKERGTLETLLTLPVSNFQMIMSKFIAVSVFACITAVLSLLSLGASVIFLLNSAVSATEGLEGFDLGKIISCMPILLVVMIVTALLITAFCMCFCIFAKSFKEANNYITPVMLIVMVASMAGMIPSINLTYQTALIPIVNVSLLIKQIMAQNIDLGLAGVTIGINLSYSILIIWLLGKMYDSENILFNDGFQSFKIFEKRSEIKKGTVPKTGDVLLAATVLLLLMLYVGSAVSVKSPFGSTVVSQVMILAIPLLMAWYMKSDVKELYAFKVPKVKGVLGGFILYVGSYALMLLVSYGLMILFPESAQNTQAAFEELLQQPFVLVILVMAVMPGIGEELFFRGMMYGSFRHKYGAWWAILLSSLIFGIYHLQLVKILPTALLGACFAYIVYKTGSIFIGMMLHFLNNFVSALCMVYPNQMGEVLPILLKPEFSGTDMVVLVVVSVACIVTGCSILRKCDL